MKPTKKKVVKIEGWAFIWMGRKIGELKHGDMLQFSESKDDLKKWALENPKKTPKNFSFVPCTITYTIPTKRGKRG